MKIIVSCRFNKIHFRDISPAVLESKTYRTSQFCTTRITLDLKNHYLGSLCLSRLTSNTSFPACGLFLFFPSTAHRHIRKKNVQTHTNTHIHAHTRAHTDMGDVDLQQGGSSSVSSGSIQFQVDYRQGTLWCLSTESKFRKRLQSIVCHSFSAIVQPAMELHTVIL